jgi:hypothetical protein
MVAPTESPDDDEEKENAMERGWRWIKAHPKLVILLVRIIPLGMLLFGFAVILWIKLREIGVW